MDSRGFQPRILLRRRLLNLYRLGWLGPSLFGFFEICCPKFSIFQNINKNFYTVQEYHPNLLQVHMNIQKKNKYYQDFSIYNLLYNNVSFILLFLQILCSQKDSNLQLAITSPIVTIRVRLWYFYLSAIFQLGTS